MEFKDELTNVLNEMGLSDILVQLDTNPGGKVGGYIVSSAFEGKSQIDRQDIVWNYLEDVLPKDKQLRIISLLTLTADEADTAA